MHQGGCIGRRGMHPSAECHRVPSCCSAAGAAEAAGACVPSPAGCKVLCRGCSSCKGVHPGIADIEAVAMLPSTQCPQGRVSESDGLQGRR
jgi:hypothetical protein